jgi:GNAT superfamily N-acetyltransferase
MTAPPFARALLSRIEDAGLNASAPPQQRWVDGWLVRFSPGKAQRARCVNAVADGLLPIEQRLALCEAVYREAGLPMVVRITPFSRPDGLDPLLDRLGYARDDETSVMVCTALPASAEESWPDAVEVCSVDLEAYAHIVGEQRGTSPGGIEAHVQRLRASPVPYRAWLVRDAAGTVLAGAQSATEADMVGLYDVFTAPAARNRGLSRRLCARLLADACRDGARLAYLQVDRRNDPARAVYRRLGFAEAYTYHYRSRPAG